MRVISALGAASSIKRLPSRLLDGRICRVAGPISMANLVFDKVFTCAR